MKRISRWLLGMVLMGVGVSIQAAENPVDVAIEGNLSKQTQVGESYLRVYTLTASKKLPPAALVIKTDIALKGSGLRVADFCNQKALYPGQSCRVVIHYEALQAQQATIKFAYIYGNTTIRLGDFVTTTSGVVPIEDVRVLEPDLPAITFLTNPITQYEFQATVENRGTEDELGFGSVSINDPNAAEVALDLTKTTCGISSSDQKVLPKTSGTCIVAGSFTPKTINTTPTVTVTYTFDNGQQSRKNSKQTHIRPGGSCQVQGRLSLDFPVLSSGNKQVGRYSDSVLAFSYTNNCTTAKTLGDVSFAHNFAANDIIITKGDDDCSSKTLAPNASCKVKVSIMPQVSGSLTVTANVTGANSLSAATTVNQNPYNHTVTFINQCPFPVWYGVQNTGEATKTDPTSPDSPSDYQLQSPGGGHNAKQVVFANGYNGLFFGRTNCTTDTNGSLVCGQPNCPTQSGTGKCSATSPQNPYTRLEMDFETAANADGVYNVSVINGVNLPVAFKGLGPFDNTSVNTNPNAPFTCAAIGAPIQPTRADGQLGSCPWTFTPPTGTNNSNQAINASDFYLVTNNGQGETNCKTNGCSDSSDTCGMSYVDFSSNDFRLTRACGKVIGYWTVNDFCGIPSGQYPDSDQNTLFMCGESLNTLLGTNKYQSNATNVTDLMTCVPQGSDLDTCYQESPSDTCCGCVNWNSTTPYTTWQSTNCTANTDWATSTPLMFSPKDSIDWLKTACPTSYVFPFDDKSSSATCNDTSSNPSGNNQMDYQVVFCPGGETGLPSA